MKYFQFIKSGAFIAIIGIVLFSAKAVMVKMAYEYQVNPIHLLLFRMFFSLPFYVIILMVNSLKSTIKHSKKDYLWLFFFGFIGYYLSSYFDFLGLQYVKAGVERIILFAYPTLVLLLSRVLFKERITQKQLIAIIITYLGIVIAFWEDIQFSNSKIILGGFLVLLSALTYASYLVGSGWLIPKFGVRVFTSYAMIVSTICVGIHYLISDRTAVFVYPNEVYLLGFLMAVLSTLIPSFLVSLAIKKMGASNFSILGSIGPISTILLAYLFLDEKLTLAQIIGAIVVIVGVSFVTKSSKKNR